MDFTYYVLKNKCSGRVLDVRGEGTSPGTEVLLYSRHNGNNQIWYQDPTRGIIVSKLNGFCLDFEGGKLVINPFRPGDENQQWEFHEEKIRNKINRDQVIESHNDILKIGVKDDDSTGQKWDFNEIGNSADISRPPLFYIVSELNGKVLDIDKGLDEEDAKLEMWNRSPERLLNQLWYVDHYGYIHSALNNMVFRNKEAGKKLKMGYYKNTPRHQWKIDGNKILNGDGECLDIIAENDEDGANLCSYEYRDQANQHWKIDHECK